MSPQEEGCSDLGVAAERGGQDHSQGPAGTRTLGPLVTCQQLLASSPEHSFSAPTPEALMQQHPAPLCLFHCRGHPKRSPPPLPSVAVLREVTVDLALGQEEEGNRCQWLGWQVRLALLDSWYHASDLGDQASPTIITVGPQ